MTHRATNLALAALAAVLFVGVVLPLFAGPDPSESNPRQSPDRNGHVATPAARTPSTPSHKFPERPLAASAFRTYAVSLADLDGLPPDARPGTTIDIWVAWDPPLTNRPKIQRLLRDVIVDRIVPPLTPEGSPAVLLSVRPDQIPDLLWGDRYGSLSATVVPTGQ